ncbi:apolipo protein O-domain-containing protein [Schizophyllum amplum]|uniref:MICOS complex subunit n=1 Tax=Schizophyllum amplum TaxID=97359 RepID=A0A550C8I7_9AGAR|nr:apolipo protein O-domain-containing protein [Auriculariopsis ampla]
MAASTVMLATPSGEREKLPIYPQPATSLELIDEPLPLEKEIGVARRAATQTVRDIQAQAQGVVSKWIGVEKAVEHRVKALAAPNESMTPALLFVGIATLTGSILTRNRMLLTRLVIPPAFLIGSMNYFLPQTSANISAYCASIEEAHFPTLAEKHAIANAHTAMTWYRLKDATQSGREKMGDGVLAAVEATQSLTGLKLKEALGWSKARAAEVKEQARVIAEDAEAKVRETTTAAETKVEEKTEEVKSDRLV